MEDRIQIGLMSYNPIPYHESGYCEVPADLENVAAASELLKGFCQRKCLDETMWPQIDLAFCECFNNAIEHGCNEDPSKTVIARWTWRDSTLEIEVEDPGAFFESPNADASLPDNPLDESGRGYFIIDTIARTHSREKTEYGQKITLEITVHPANNVINQMEEIYTILQTMNHDLNAAHAERDIVVGFTKDISSSPFIESIIESGINRLKGLVEIPQVDVWTLGKGSILENTYHEGPQALAPDRTEIAPNKNSPCAAAIATETEQYVNDCSKLDDHDPAYRESGCALVYPIIYQRDCIGAIAIHSTQNDKKILFEQVLPLVRVFSQFLGLAYTSTKTFAQREEHERSKTQLEVASEIQKSLLPSSYPSNNYCKVIGRCDPALAVGGDYIDAIEIRDVGLLIIIADVMGKGVPAALLATIFRTAIRSRLHLAETPGWMLSKINKQIHEELGHLNMFITAQAAFLTYNKKKLKLANAGHCPALLIKSENSGVEQLLAEGMPLGIDPDDIYEERIIDLEEGSRVIFLTDGFYEAENKNGEMLGIDRLVKATPDFWKDGIDFVTNRAFDFVSKFTTGRSAQDDDQTLMAVEIL